ncbi:RNA polymerase subunit sigma [Sinomicrobium sp. FJxs]|uniref:RNA polymerase subunit sigma n=2 Tax=Sinomicrobium weinanense TaxID=2842200 RepID=A0A926JTN0_9FLAO|nr:RNA polymerase subunit sigma [Sinomicrobium weinanense]
MKEENVLKDLFQREFSKMVAVISKLYGLQHIEIAEDIVSETFLVAAETWGVKGMPENPTAWLYVVAKQKTLYHFRRNKIFDEKVVPALPRDPENHGNTTIPDFSEGNIRDSQLQMLFAVCNPAITSEAQMGLALRILCGFGIDEIAEAFLSKKDTINKRLFRAKDKLRTANIKMEFPPEHEIIPRLDNVLHIIYLLFNEGYYSRTQNHILRKDLCLEAMRLGIMLSEYEKTNLPKTNALIALMCFHASRFDARQSEGNNFILYKHQNPELWDKTLIKQGMRFLELSARGEEISSYHLEAKIACWHCYREDTAEKWEDILQLYDSLLKLNYSPVVALNRIYALYKAEGERAALEEAEGLNMEGSHFYYVLLGELYKNMNREKARASLKKAYALAGTPPEKEEIQKQINGL